MSKVSAPAISKVKEILSPSRKALETARWARTMTKVAISLSRKGGVKWVFVEFGGSTGAESRGIVDIIAIRKNHKDTNGSKVAKKGDFFDIVLIQTKGGSAESPSDRDIERLHEVKKHHRAKAIVLAEWKKGKKANLFRLDGGGWKPVEPAEIFG
jgi:hypothetical protein